MYFFTADEHYGHRNIIKYCNRPFKSVEEMDNTIISRHNEIVSNNDIVIHVGDFTLGNLAIANKYIKQLNGYPIFLEGSHDNWLKGRHARQIWEKTIENTHVVVCHYAMRVWARSHYNSWLLYGHSHGQLDPVGKSWDVGVDNNNFYPISFDQLKIIMKNRPDNPNLIDKSK